MDSKFRWSLLVFLIFTWISHIASKELRVVCYYTNWSVYRPGTAKFSPQNINPYLCTHLVYAFGGFTKENTLKPFDKYQDIEKGGYAKFTGLKTYNKNLKTMLAIGGWNEGSSRFSPMVASAERRKELVKNVVKFLRQNHFDGLDLDWEYPSFRDGGKSRDRDNYAQLVQELREEFERESAKTGRTRLLLTMAVPAGIEYINKGYDVPKLMKYLDWMNILSYDYHSAFEPSVNHHAPLYPLEEDSEYNYDTELNIDYTIKHYLEAGAISSKLVLGIPTYGRSYTLFNSDSYDIGAPADGPGDMGDATRENGYLAYYEICENVKSGDWTVVQPNDDAMGPYAYRDNQWVGYDDEAIVRKKAQYVADKDLGGIMFWAIDNDDFRGTCHNKPYPLIEAAKEALVEALGLTEENAIQTPSKSVKNRNRSRGKVTQKAVDSGTKEGGLNSGGRQGADKPTNRRRPVNKHTTEKPEPTKATRRRRPVTKKVEKLNDDSNNYQESGSSLVVTPGYLTPEPPTTPDPGGDFKCEDEGFYPHPRDCKKYFWCLNGPSELGIIAHQFTCPAGLYFNKAASSCDYTQNVLCNKKISKTTTTTPPSTPTSKVTSTTESEPSNYDEGDEPPKSAFSFSTRRPAPKITAATSRTTFQSTTSTTAEPEYEEYEYEDDVGEDTDAEDPKVIKELLDLIRKAGGIEELEKTLNLKDEPSSSVGPNSGSTTTSPLSKKIFAKVLARTKLGDITTRKSAYKYNSVNRNSRGPQNEGISKEEKQKSGILNSRSARPQYSTISRQRATKPKTDDDEETETDESNDETIAQDKPKIPDYKTLRRSRLSTTVGPDRADKDIVGDTDSDSILENKFSTTSTSRSPYVTLRRSRPTTTATTIDDNFLKRKALGEDEEEDAAEADNDSVNYAVNQRSRPTTEATIGSSSKYKEIRRSTTTTPKIILEEESPTISNSESSSTISTLNTDSQIKLTENSNTSIIARTTEETIINLISLNTEKLSNELISTTEKQEILPPQLLEPRPFSFNTNVRSTTLKTTSTETSTTATKVSYKPLLRSRTPIEAPDSNLDVNNIKVENVNKTRTRVRGSSRFNVPETSQAKQQAQEERLYRPDLSSDISDFSSLTAVDFSFNANSGISNNRRSRPRPTTVIISTVTEAATAATEENSKSVPKAPGIRKFLERPAFGNQKRRLNLSTTENVIANNTEEDITGSKNINENKDVTTKLNRKIIRKFRPTTALLPVSEEESIRRFRSSTVPNIINSSTITSNAKRNLRFNRIRTTPLPYVRQRTTSTEEADNKSIEEEGENIKLSESNILENSDVNRFNTNSIKSETEKGYKKVIKRIKPSTPFDVTTEEIIQDDINNNITTTKSNIDNENITVISETTTHSTNSSPLLDQEVSTANKSIVTEANLVVRTRKIVRKLPTTPATTTFEVKEVSEISEEVSTENKIDATTEDVQLNRRRKVIRRFRPTTESTTSHPVTEQVKIEEVATEETSTENKLANKEVVEEDLKIVNEESIPKEEIANNSVNVTNVEARFGQLEESVFMLNETENILQEGKNNETATISNSTILQEEENNNETTPISNSTILQEEENNNETSTISSLEKDNSTTSQLPLGNLTDIETPTTSPSPVISTPHSSTKKIFKTAEARPKLDLRQRLSAAKYTTEASIKTTKSRFELRSRRPSRFRPTTETVKQEVVNIREEQIEDVGHGTVKPFKKLFTSTERSYTRESPFRNDRINPKDEDNSDDEDDASKSLIPSTSAKTYLRSKPVFEEDVEDSIEDDDDENYDDDLVEPDSDEEEIEGEGENKPVKNNFSPFNKRPKYVFTTRRTTTVEDIEERTRKANNPNESVSKTTKRIKSTTRGGYKRFTTTTPTSVTQNLTDINLDAVNQRNKQLFNKTRKMNTPHAGPTVEISNFTTQFIKNLSQFDNTTITEASNVTTTEESNVTTMETIETTTDLNSFSTDLNPIVLSNEITTIPNEVETTFFTNEIEKSVSNLDVTTISARTTTEKPTTFYHIFAETESSPTPSPTSEDNRSNKQEKLIEVNRIVEGNGGNNEIDHLGAINRVTNIQIVDGNNITNIRNYSYDYKPLVAISPNTLPEILNNNLYNTSNRDDRKYEIYGDSKVSNYAIGTPEIINARNVEINPNQITIDSKSLVKTNTPKPLFSNEVSTIALEGLFRTDSPYGISSTTTTSDELLDTDQTKYVNIKLLDQDEARSSKDVIDSHAKFIPIKLLNDEDVTMKAEVVEIPRPSNLEIIKIAPIAVSFEKKIM